jgi:hypothetical protein
LEGPALFRGEKIKRILKIMLDKDYKKANIDDQTTTVKNWRIRCIASKFTAQSTKLWRAAQCVSRDLLLSYQNTF